MKSFVQIKVINDHQEDIEDLIKEKNEINDKIWALKREMTESLDSYVKTLDDLEISIKLYRTNQTKNI